MALVDNQQEILRKIIQQGKRWLSWLASINVHRIILNAVTKAHLLHHLKVILCAHRQALSFEQFAIGLKPLQSLLQLFFDSNDCSPHVFCACGIMSRRKHNEFCECAQSLTCHRIDAGDAVNRVAKHLNTHHGFFIRGMHFNRVSTNPEITPTQSHVIAVVLQVNQSSQNASLVIVDANMKFK